MGELLAAPAPVKEAAETMESLEDPQQLQEPLQEHLQIDDAPQGLDAPQHQDTVPDEYQQLHQQTSSPAATEPAEEQGLEPPVELQSNEAKSDQQRRPESSGEPEVDARDVLHNLDVLQKQLAQGHGILETQSSETDSATIADTAAHVRQISSELDDLQQQLALTYPMTDEEKAACRLPAVSLRPTPFSNRGSARGTDRMPYLGSALSLADACAVLRGVANRGQVSAQEDVLQDTLVSNTSFAISVDDLTSEAPSRKHAAQLRSYDGAKATDAAGNCGAELRKATAVLQRQLRRGVAGR